MEPTMQELRRFFVNMKADELHKIEETFVEMRRAGIVEGPINHYDRGPSYRLARQTELAKLWVDVQHDAVQFAELKHLFLQSRAK
jgi:hypothetical protein